MSKPKKNQILQFMTPFVDRTDFASIESGVTSGFTQRLWGVKHGVSAAATAKTPSKTLSVVRSGVFRVTLKATEVSDFDQVFWQGTHASCADQNWSFDLLDNDDSDMMSALTVIQSMASDAHSAATQANSRVLLIQSRLSDLDSRLVSDLSDVLSAVNVGNSRILLVQSQASDTYSLLSDFQSDFQSRVPKRVATDSQLSNVHSDIVSALGTINVTLTVSDISDIASAVDAALASRLSDILSAAQQGNSRVLVVQSQVSDTYSMLSDFYSDFGSRVPKRVATDSQLSNVHSDLLSALGNISVTLTASDISDIASAVVANLPGLNASDISDIASAVDAALASRLSDILSAAQQSNSRVLVVQSQASDTYSLLSQTYSDLLSLVTTTGVQLNASMLSDLRSAIADGGGSITASDISDIASAVYGILSSDLSDILSAAQQGNSRVLVVQSRLSDLDSRLVSDLSDVLSAVNVGNSRVLLTQSQLSDTYSMLSDFYSDFGSRVPKRVATDSQLSNVHSDILSALGNISVTLTASDISDIASAVVANLPGLNASDISDIASAVRATLASDLSDILSAAQQGNSRILLTQSLASDTYSLLSQTYSDLLSVVGTTGVQLNASTLSDLRSAITAGGGSITASDISDIASAVYGLLASDLSDTLSAARQGVSKLTLVQSMASDVYSLLSDVSSDLGVMSGVLSDTYSGIVALSGAVSDAHSAAAQGNSRAALALSQTSDIYSLLSSLESDVQSRFPATIPELATDPGATPTWAQAEAMQFMWLRNNSKTTSTKRHLRNNAGTTVLSATLGDDGTSYVQGKLG